MSESKILDTTSGPIFRPLITYSVPIMLANILQLLFNAADIVVVGQFVGETAVAAVGSTSIIINILVSLFTGLSIGATALISMNLGKGIRNLDRLIHTTYTLGVVLGLFAMIAGIIFAPGALKLLNTPSDIISQADIYLRIYFLGQPGFMIYTFARAILVSKGDTKSPFNYLLFAGIVNVVLNVLLVTIVKLGVAGVAIATVTSHYISAILTTRKLVKSNDMFHINLRSLCLDRNETLSIIKSGLPNGLQSSLLTIAGLILQRSINSLGTNVVAGQSAANNIMSFIAQSLNAFSQGCMTFTSQNFGAKKSNRVRKVFRCTLLIDLIIGILLGAVLFFFGRTLLRIYIPACEGAVDAGMVLISTLMYLTFLLGFQDTASFVLRGMNYSMLPMLISLFGNCAFRVLWLFLVFNRFAPGLNPLDAYQIIVASYPITWLLIFAANLTAYFIILRKN